MQINRYLEEGLHALGRPTAALPGIIGRAPGTKRRLRRFFIGTGVLLVYLLAGHCWAETGQAVQSPPGNEAGPTPFFRKALFYHRDGRWVDALRLYRKVLQLDPDNQPAMLNQAAIFLQQGAYREAQQLLRRLEAAPTQPQGVQFNLALVALGLNKPDQAIAYLDKAQRNQDAHPTEILYHRAIACARLNRLPEALSLFRKALAQSPQDALLRFNLAVTLDTMGRYPEALLHYEAIRTSASLANERQTIAQRIRILRGYLNNNRHVKVKP